MSVAVPAIVTAAWEELGAPGRFAQAREMSANVSTNRVYLLTLDNRTEVVAKTSGYGSYVHFRQDHQLIDQWIQQLQSTRYANFLARVMIRGERIFTYREGQEWVVFYEKSSFYDFLPKVLGDSQVVALGRELASFHIASERASEQMNPSWKSVGSDIATLFDFVGNGEWRKERGIPDAMENELRRHCELFLENSEKIGYHDFPHIPVLVDWNIGNFSVGFDADGFKFFSRWDYDWFRIEPRTMDFYFCARVVRAEGDQSTFSYLADPLFDPRFKMFLRAYHRVSPLSQSDILFLKEAYRFFILNYVIRSGEHFFRPSICQRLQREALERYLPALEDIDMRPLLDVLD